MNNTDSIFQQAISNMLTEIFDGPPGRDAYLLNPGDPGLLRWLDQVDASAASKRPMPVGGSKTTIAAHADHIHYGLAILNRWADGDPNPWAGADWGASWKRAEVTAEQWQELRANLRSQAEKWRHVMATRKDWDAMSAAAAVSTAAHTAYHLGAIRQLMASVQA